MIDKDPESDQSFVMTPNGIRSPKITIAPTLQGRLRLNQVIAYLLNRT